MNSGDRDYSTRTFGNEQLLPRVPLPEPADSCARFLDWCAPLLTPAELAETSAAVEQFLSVDSPAWGLHEALREFDGRPDGHSWLDLFWPYRYLGRRDRIALNANFFFLFRDGTKPPAQLDRAANLVARAVELKLRLDEERVPPVLLRGRPQSMEQYKYLFSTTRIPGAEIDTVRAPYSAEAPGPATARHIVVFTGGRLARLDVLDEAGRPYPENVLAEALASVRDAAAERPAQRVGQLTTMARAEWAARRETLDPAALETVETALFCLCLDPDVPADDLAACDRLLHGDSANRWFDKAVSLIVFGDGRAGINVEHCELDGTTILSFTDTILTAPPEQGPHAAGRPAFEPVEFVLDDDAHAAIEAAGAAFDQFAADTASQVVSLTDFGSDRAKKLGMSPDAFVQMAYQLAHYRAKGLIGATYESIATRQFRLGRTEAMRVVTPEVLRFVDAMHDASASPETRAEAFRQAAQAHVARAKDCQQGLAPEQHLWELQLIQRRRGSTEPLALYDSPGWLKMRDDYLSTSSAPSVNISYFGFGSTSSRCIGVAYVLLPDRLNIYLSTPRAVAAEMATFATELRRAVDELATLLTTA